MFDDAVLKYDDGAVIGAEVPNRGSQWPMPLGICGEDSGQGGVPIATPGPIVPTQASWSSEAQK
jgi:hypothetical protein